MKKLRDGWAQVTSALVNFSTSVKSVPVSKTSVALVLFCLVFLNIKYDYPANRNVIQWDVVSYYSYLPAAFIKQDLTLSFLDGREEEYAHKSQYWPEDTPTGGRVIKTTAGLAYLYAPFFFAAHVEAGLTGYEQNGYTAPYHKWIHWSVLFYVFLGLLSLRKVLLRFFSEGACALTLLLVTLGTNMLYYTIHEGAMSHAYNFSLISFLLLAFFHWHERPSKGNSILLGILSGVIVLVRPVNILALLFPLLYLLSFSGGGGLLRLVKERIFQVLIIVFFAFLAVLPQLIYWKINTGSFLFFSYGEERFYFDQPKILEGLLSYRKGWLVYTPVMIFSLLGFIPLYKRYKSLFWSILPAVVINIFVIFSWWAWWYGGSFGMRAMIDFYPLLAVPFAAFIQYISERRYSVFPLSIFAAGLFCCYLNFFHTHQKHLGILHWDGMTKEMYWQSFLSFKVPPEYYEKANRPDYEKAVKGEEEYEFNPF